MGQTQANNNGANGNGRAKLAWGIKEAAQACSVSVDYLRKEISNGRLLARHRGRRVLIEDSELRRWLTSGKEADTGAE